MSKKSLHIEGMKSPKLESYMRQNIPGYKGPCTITTIHGGQSNPTYHCQSPTHDFVLRTRPPGQLLPSAHAIDREFRVMSALQQTKIKVAQPIVYCDNDDVLGSEFYLAAFVSGAVYRSFSEVPAEGSARLIKDAVAHLALLHNQPYSTLGLASFGKSGDFFSRQINRWWRQYEASNPRHRVEVGRIKQWLDKNRPVQSLTGITHGDYSINNLIVNPEDYQLKAIVDWELSTIGYPPLDLAYFCLPWYIVHNDIMPPVACMGQPLQAHMLHIDEVQAIYERGTQKKIQHWNFLLVLSFFRSLSIWQGVIERMEIGNAVEQDPCAKKQFEQKLEVLLKSAQGLVH